MYFGNEALVSHIIWKYFSQSVGCLFVLFMVSFAVQKPVSSIMSHLSIFAFTLLPWETNLIKHWMIYVRECLACILFYEFYVIMPYV